MQRFPIEWKLRPDDTSYSSPSLLQVKLNNEWTLSCVLKYLSGSKEYELETLKIDGKVNGDGFSVSGTLSFRRYGEKTISTQAFTKLIETGSAFTKLIDHPSGVIFKSRNDEIFVHGVVNVTYVGVKLPTDWETKGIRIYFQPKSLVQLSDDFKRLLDPENPSCNADLNLKCGSTSIPVHKLILSARSPVFAAMCKNPMEESHKNEVDITDIVEPVLRAMVNYIYTGKTSGLTVSSASDLLYAADKYQLPDLKRVCCDFLQENISLQNVMSIIVLGDLYENYLKTFGMDYVCKKYRNFPDFENIEEWKTLKKDRPALAVEILECLLKSKDHVNK